MTKKFNKLVLFLLILTIIGCSVLYMSNGMYESICFWAIDLDSIFLFVIYHLIFIFPLIIITISSKKKNVRILGLLSILLLIYPLMIIYSGLPSLGIRINYSEVLLIVSLAILFILLLILFLIEKNSNLISKIYVISLLFYAFITLLDRFGILTSILSVFDITRHTSIIHHRIVYLTKQDFIIYTSWIYYFIYLRDNIFISINSVNKQVSKSSFIWLWLFFGLLGLERIYYPKHKNITNYQLLSTSCFIPLMIYRDIAEVLSLNNIIIYNILIIIFVFKIIVWIYSLIEFLMVNNKGNNEIIQDKILL